MNKVNYDLLDNSIIGFFEISGWKESEDKQLLSNYFLEPNGIAWDFLERMPKEKYGSEVNMILFQLHTQGSNDWFTMPKKNTLGSYAKKQKSWNYKTPLTIERQEVIQSMQDMKLFIAEALSDLRSIMMKRKMPENFDFDFFIQDLQNIEEAYKK